MGDSERERESESKGESEFVGQELGSSYLDTLETFFVNNLNYRNRIKYFSLSKGEEKYLILLR